jgi:hypothetical protein
MVKKLFTNLGGGGGLAMELGCEKKEGCMKKEV